MNTFEYICIALSTRQFREIGMPKKPHQDAALIVGINVRDAPTQDFPSEVNCWGDFWPKQPKTALKEQNQHFGGKIVWGTWGNMGGLAKVLGGKG